MDVLESHCAIVCQTLCVKSRKQIVGSSWSLFEVKLIAFKLCKLCACACVFLFIYDKYIYLAQVLKLAFTFRDHLRHFDMVKADERFTSAVVDAVRKHLADSSRGALARWNDIWVVLEEAKITYVKTLLPGEVMVHPRNRGGTGLNAHEAHRTLSNVLSAGCDLEHLKKATCFELNPNDGSARQGAIDFNQELIDRADGLLPDLTGAERCLSVSCSHWTAACRATIAGCRTEEEFLQDDEGRLNKIKLGKDKVFNSILEKGFPWRIVPFICDEVFGEELADLAQDALNAEQAAFNRPSELQSMLSIAVALEKPKTKDDYEAATKHAASALPP